ncbi:MAG: extracellular solute-binding protein, partial [Rhodocyclaceae bacterium]|nr:extracellular solute-binding protein [Rhodocyclaceae bacterium]
WQAANESLLQPARSSALDAAIPAHLRAPGGEWYGLSVRARTIVYAQGKVDTATLSTYQDLAAPKWHGKLCLRTSKKVYNQSLVAAMIAQYGEAETERIVRGWVANLATDVFADDTALIKAIAAGQCQVGIVNTYYLGRLLAKDANYPVGLFWANQGAEGVHVNVSGAGITRHAKNAAGARKLLEYLAAPKAQSIYTDEDLEYPANPAVKPDSVIKAWGEFKPSQLNVAKLGELQAAATRLMDRAGYK